MTKLFHPNETLLFNFLVIDEKNKIDNANINIKTKLSIFEILVTNNYIINSEFFETLLDLNKEDSDILYFSLKTKLNSPKGVFFKNSFATKSKIKNEKMDYNDYFDQIFDYFLNYGLEMPNVNLLKEKSKNKRDVQVKEKSKNIKKLNKKIDIISKEELNKKIENTIFMPIVFGETEKDFLETFYNIDSNLIFNYSLNNIKIKENILYFLRLMNLEEIISNHLLKTTNDILRYIYLINDLPNAVTLSKEDFDIMKIHKEYIKLKTSEKKKIFNLLNIIIKKDFERAYEEMYIKSSQWKYILKHMYPLSKQYNIYRDMQNMVYLLNNNIKVQNFNSKKTELMKNVSIIPFIDLHINKNRFGDLFRNLDFVIRNSNEKELNYLILQLDENKEKINIKLLIQVLSYLKYRTINDIDVRYFNAKDKLKKIEDKPLKKLDENDVKKIEKLFFNILKFNFYGKELF